jgi:hypothetical protein
VAKQLCRTIVTEPCRWISKWPCVQHRAAPHVTSLSQTVDDGAGLAVTVGSSGNPKSGFEQDFQGWGSMVGDRVDKSSSPPPEPRFFALRLVRALRVCVECSEVIVNVTERNRSLIRVAPLFARAEDEVFELLGRPGPGVRSSSEGPPDSCKT